MKNDIEFNKKVTFKAFQEVCSIAIHFTDAMDLDEIDEVVNDIYAIYKDSGFDDPVHFLEYQQMVDVTRKSHDFWLSPVGIRLLKIENRI